VLIAGIIAEYDPFHAGHAWHIAETRRCTGCDYVAVAMAGSFTQRGEAACLSKAARVRMALRGGADAVFELPALFVVRSADAFARGGVGVLAGLGVDVLSFGAECGDIALLRRVASLRDGEDAAFERLLREGLERGESHPRAWGEAAARVLGLGGDLLAQPNNALAVEYMRALYALRARTEPLAIPRRGRYHGALDGEGFASASAIRAALFTDRRPEALAAVPACVREIAAAAAPMHAPDDLLLWTLRNMSDAEIAALADVPEGLEHRIKALAAEVPSREALIDRVKSKRYTRARIARITTHALLGLTRALADRHAWPAYARLLGVRRDAMPLLTELKRRASLPIASDPVGLKGDEVFQLECRATDLRALMCEGGEARRAGQELTTKFIVEEGYGS